MASRYWIGGSGTWDASSTANWSTTSGGTGGASVPTIADDAYFDQNSGSGVVTLTGDVTCRRVYQNYSISGGDISLLVPSGQTVTIPRYEGGTYKENTLEVNGTLVVDNLWFAAGPAIERISGSGTILVQRISSFSSSSLEFYNISYIEPTIIIDSPTSTLVNLSAVDITYKEIQVINGSIFSLRYDNPIVESLTITDSTFRARSLSAGDTTTVIQNYTHIGGVITTSSVAGNSAEITITGTTNVRGVTISDIVVLGTSLTAINSTDGGNNTNISFIQRPINLTGSTPPTIYLADSYENLESGFGAYTLSNGLGQSFQSSGGFLEYIDLRLRKTDDTAVSLSAAIYAHSGVFGTSSLLTGEPLAVSDSVSIADVPSSYDWVRFNFGTTFVFQPDEYYCIVLTPEVSTSGVSSTATENSLSTPPFADGNLMARLTTTWESSAIYDILYRVYVRDPLVTNKTTSPSSIINLNTNPSSLTNL